MGTQRTTPVLRIFAIFQWHLRQKALYYLVAATSQLYSGLNSQNYNIPPKLFRKSYIPSSGDRSNIIPEGSWCYVLFNYLRIKKSILNEFFLPSKLKIPFCITWALRNFSVSFSNLSLILQLEVIFFFLFFFSLPPFAKGNSHSGILTPGASRYFVLWVFSSRWYRTSCRMS